MDNKTFWTSFLVSLVVALVVSVIAGSMIATRAPALGPNATVVNASVKPITPKMPDLISDITSIDKQCGHVGNISVGPCNVTVQFKVKNIGNKVAGASTVQYTLGGDHGGGAQYLFTPSLAPSQSQFYTRIHWVLYYGNYAAGTFADVFNNVTESNEDNNQDTAFFSVP